ncbi:MAG: hypothetical protein WAT66_15910 [Actinomycetota bacterium]
MKRSTLIVFAAIVALVVVATAGAALAANPNAGCHQTPYENTSGNGANHSGTYDDTCDGSASGNGNGGGNANGKPCAGCVGNADEKNPPGQDPDGSDGNSGYECDENAGVGKTNPAHTGCASTSNPENPPENPPGGNPPGSQVLGRKFTRPLATTGVEVPVFFAVGVLFLIGGVTLRARTARA